MVVHRFIPLTDHRKLSGSSGARPDRNEPPGLLLDALGRPLRDLRISVTDRCNFRCSYCMPKNIFDKQHAFLPQSALLTFEEITRMARLFTGHGVQKIRLTGGEPLLRKDLERLVRSLSSLKTLSGEVLDLTLTTNGSLLARQAAALKQAGLLRLTVSLDALDDRTFRQMNDVDFPVSTVLAGIQEAQRVGFHSMKVNMVIKRGTNDHEILPMAAHFRGTPTVLRFIEYMDVGATNGWHMKEVLPSTEVIRRLNEVHPLEAVAPHQPGETASRWRYRDGSGEIGVISSVTQAFCHDCNRARLTTEGRLFLCLFATQGHDLRTLLRAGYSDEEIAEAIHHLWRQRDDRYSQLRGTVPSPHGDLPGKRVEMHYIGG